MTAPMIEVDGRSRVTLPGGKAGRKFLVHEDEDGGLYLEPAVVLSAMEVRALRSPQIQAALVAAKDPARLRDRPARRS